jgi:hypothetical protein
MCCAQLLSLNYTSFLQELIENILKQEVGEDRCVITNNNQKFFISSRHLIAEVKHEAPN